MKEINISMRGYISNGEIRWFGRTPGINDKHGNELDCFLYSPQEALDCLLEQLKEEKVEIK